MRASEDGFTLVEVILAVTIMGFIGGAVAMSMIIGLRTTDATINRLVDSQDAQLAAAFFGTDVQEADKLSVDPADAETCAGAEAKILDLVKEPTDGEPSEHTVVSYAAIERAPGGLVDLHRMTCKVVAGVPGPPTDDVVVAENLVRDQTSAACIPASCQGSTQVRMHVAVIGCSQLASSCRPELDSFIYDYELLGSRRAA